MNNGQSYANFKQGLLWCWLSLFVLPLGALFGAIGICAGPGNKLDATALLGIGIGGIVIALCSGFYVVRGIRLGNWILRLFAILSLCSAAVVGFFGWIYAFEAWEYFRSVLRNS